MNDRQEIPETEYDRPLNKGGDLPPLPLLPDREWLRATIAEVKYRYQMFNGQIQYRMRPEWDEETNQEIQVPVTDDDGQPIARREFNLKFELEDYSLPNNKGPRCCWLSLGEAMGDKAHLPVVLYNVLGPDFNPDSPRDIINGLTGMRVKLQLANKPNKKDPTKPPFQRVIYDAVMARGTPEPAQKPKPLDDFDLGPDPADDFSNEAI